MRATAEQWLRHWRRMAVGDIQPDAQGFWTVDMSPIKKEGLKSPNLQIISPTQQTVEQAKAKTKTTTKKRKMTKSLSTKRKQTPPKQTKGRKSTNQKGGGVKKAIKMKPTTKKKQSVAKRSTKHIGRKPVY